MIAHRELCEAGNAGEDLVRSLDPLEGLGVAVVVLDEIPDRPLQFAHAAVRAALDLALSEKREPGTDHGRLVGAGVVQDQVYVERLRDIGIDRVEELAELEGTVPGMDLADDLACRDFQARVASPWLVLRRRR